MLTTRSPPVRDPVQSCNPSAARKRRARQRQEAGQLVVWLIVDQQDTAVLHDVGLLGVGELDDRAAIAGAIRKLIRLLPELDSLDVRGEQSAAPG